MSDKVTRMRFENGLTVMYTLEDEFAAVPSYSAVVAEGLDFVTPQFYSKRDSVIATGLTADELLNIMQQAHDSIRG